MNKLRRTGKGIGSFLVMAGVLAVLLAVLNWLPDIIWTGTVKRYQSIEDVSRALGIKNVPVPTYFPENISWPPSSIIAQGHPYQAIAMEFTSSATGGSALIITRTSLGQQPLLDTALDGTDEEAPFDLNGRKALLSTGTCGDAPCSLMVWDEAGMRTRVLLHAGPFDLIEIARSMHH